MERELITITNDHYTLKEIKMNEELYFYNNNGENIDEESPLYILYQKYIIKRILQNDTFIENEIIFNKSLDNKFVTVNLKSFKEKSRKYILELD